MEQGRTADRRLAAGLDQLAGMRFVLTPVFLGAGIAAWFSLGDPQARALFVAICALGCALASAPRHRTAWLSLTALALGAMAAGSALVEWWARAKAAPVLTESRSAWITAVIEDDAPRDETSRRLLLRVIAIEGLPAGQTPRRVRLVDRTRQERLTAGATVRLRAMLAPPQGPARPGGHDFARRAWFEQMGAAGFVVVAPKVLAPPGRASGERLAAWRQSLAERLRAATPGPPGAGAVAAALLVGERGAVPEAWNQAARDSGVAHILSISGLHLALVTGLVMASVRLMLAATPLALMLPAKAIAAAIAGLAAIAYTLLSGAAPPTIRSCLVVLVALAALIAGRDPFSLRTLAFAALVVLLIRPESMIDVSTQMSFAAVGGLIALTTHPLAHRLFHRLPGDGWPIRAGRAILALLATSMMCELMLAPIAFHQFGRTGLFGMVTNLIAVPLTSFVIMPAGVAALLVLPFGLEQAPLWLMSKGILAMMTVAETIAALPASVLRLPVLPGPMFALCAVLMTALVVLPGQRKWAIALLLPALIGGSALLAREPLLWIGDGGRLAGFRMNDGRLAVTSASSARFARTQWTEALGLPQDSGWAKPGIGGWHCTRASCTATAPVRGGPGLGLPLLYLRTPGGLAGCARPVLVIARFDTLRRCRGALGVIDHAVLGGSSAILHASPAARGYRLQLVTSRQMRGRYPWTAQPPQ